MHHVQERLWACSAGFCRCGFRGLLGRRVLQLLGFAGLLCWVCWNQIEREGDEVLGPSTTRESACGVLELIMQAFCQPLYGTAKCASK